MYVDRKIALTTEYIRPQQGEKGQQYGCSSAVVVATAYMQLWTASGAMQLQLCCSGSVTRDGSGQECSERGAGGARAISCVEGLNGEKRESVAQASGVMSCFGAAWENPFGLAASNLNCCTRSGDFFVTLSTTARGRCLGVLPPDRYGLRIPRKTRKNEAIKIVMRRILLFIKPQFSSEHHSWIRIICKVKYFVSTY